MIKLNLPTALKRFRKERHITQKQMAEAANIHTRLYQRYEYGENEPAANTIIDIAKHFNTSLDYLTGRTDNPEINR